jgi:hypothetical protein
MPPKAGPSGPRCATSPSRPCSMPLEPMTGYQRPPYRSSKRIIASTSSEGAAPARSSRRRTAFERMSAAVMCGSRRDRSLRKRRARSDRHGSSRTYMRQGTTDDHGSCVEHSRVCCTDRSDLCRLAWDDKEVSDIAGHLAVGGVSVEADAAWRSHERYRPRSTGSRLLKVAWITLAKLSDSSYLGSSAELPRTAISSPLINWLRWSAARVHLEAHASDAPIDTAYRLKGHSNQATNMW